MTIQLTTQSAETIQANCLVLPVDHQHRLTKTGKQINKRLAGQITHMLDSGDIEKKAGETLMFHTSDKHLPRILLVSFGDPKKLTIEKFRDALQNAYKTLENHHITSATLALHEMTFAKRNLHWKIREILLSYHHAHYRFHAFKAKKEKTSITTLRLLVNKSEQTPAKQAVKEALALHEGLTLCKDLGNLPPNQCHPAHLAHTAKKLAKKYTKLHTEVLNEKEMKKLGMGAFLSVSQGSDQPAKLIVMRYQGSRTKKAPIVFVGKGITFDTGGYDLKPPQGMLDMKYDMCGGATLFGLMKTICELNLNLNVISLVAASENLVNGKASRPSDIIKTMSGQTVEIINTDAEGRLVLCDTLTYAAKFKPAEVIDIATLTGGAIVALGLKTTALFGNDARLTQGLLKASEQVEDAAWQLPMTDEGYEYLHSAHADMVNTPSGVMAAKSMIAACFLSRFCEDYRWAHLDIAGVAFKPGKHKGATGRPLPLLVQYLLNKR